MDFQKAYDAQNLSAQDYALKYAGVDHQPWEPLLAEHQALKLAMFQKGIVCLGSEQEYKEFCHLFEAHPDLEKARRDLSKLVRRRVLVRNSKTGTVYQKVVWVKLAGKQYLTTEAMDDPDDEIVDVGVELTEEDGLPVGRFIGGDIISFQVEDDQKKKVTVTGVISGQSKSKSAKDKEFAVYNVKGEDGKSYTVNEPDAQFLDVSKQVKYFEVKAGDKTKVEYDLEGFPTTLDSMTEIGKQLGGSTGAKLMRAPDGQLYVVKKGMDGKKEHAEEEYWSNVLYNMFGADVPEHKMIGDAMVMRFIDGTVSLSEAEQKYPKQREKLVKVLQKNFILDALFANWDVVQQGDNVRIDPNGRLIRVDNGGALRYRAQGGQKGAAFGEEVIEIDTLRKHNQKYFDLTDAQVAAQVEQLLEKYRNLRLGDRMISAGVPKEVRRKIEARIDSLREWYDEYLSTADHDPNEPVPLSSPEKLLAINEVVSDPLPGAVVESQLQKVWNKWKSFYATNLHPKDPYKSTGWVSVSVLAKLRGFNARPVILQPEDFDTLLDNHKDDFYLCYRGVADVGSDSFRQAKTCFYGTYGIHGSGIYATISKTGDNSLLRDHDLDSLQHARENDPNIKEAASYGHNVHQILVSKDLRIGDADALEEEIQDLLNPNNAELKKLQKAVETAQTDFNTASNAYDTARKEVIKEVKEELNILPVEKTLKRLYDGSPQDTWAKIQEMTKLAGGQIEIGENDKFKITLPSGAVHESTEQFHQVRPGFINYMKAKLRFYAGNKQKVLRTLTPGPVGDFFQREFIEKQDTIISARVAQNPKLQQLKQVSDSKFKVLEQTQKDVQNFQATGGSTRPSSMPEQIFKAMTQTWGRERIGIYATWKGYDAFRKVGGNQAGSEFMIILNRAKCIVRAKNV